MKMGYEANQFVTYKGETYLIIKVIDSIENFMALVCQKDSSGRIETIELPVIHGENQ